ncbi:hypothetical protein ACFL6C_05760 [Myxococcota bacterium]
MMSMRGALLHGTRHLRAGSMALSALMNGYYGLKSLRGTGPHTPPEPTT